MVSTTEGLGHEISFTHHGLGYCTKCDDWHDLDRLFNDGKTEEPPSYPDVTPPEWRQSGNKASFRA